jgi:uncharacterized membrane protein
MAVDPLSLATILGMAGITYLTRWAGLWLMGRFSPGPRLKAWLGYIPGAVLISIVAPAVVTQGPAEIIAAVITAGVAYKTRSLLLAMVTGVALVAGLRLVF